jgi:hypothetical protein
VAHDRIGHVHTQGLLALDLELAAGNSMSSASEDTEPVGGGPAMLINVPGAEGVDHRRDKRRASLKIVLTWVWAGWMLDPAICRVPGRQAREERRSPGGSVLAVGRATRSEPYSAEIPPLPGVPEPRHGAL